MELIMKIYALLITAFLTSPVYAAVYKCDINGKKVYQMHPCPEQEQGGEIDVSDPQPVVTQAEKIMRLKNDIGMQKIYQQRDEQYRQYEQRMDAIYNQSVAISQAKETKKELREIKDETGVLPGMTAEQVRRALGDPTVINKGNYSGTSVKEQWVYRRRNQKTQYVYLEDGIVTSQQW